MNPFLALLPVALLLLAACSPASSDAPPVIRPVKTVITTSQPLDLTAQYAGEVRARYEIPLAFRVGGKITGRPVEVGQSVSAGEMLMQLDPGDLALTEQALRAQLGAARADRDQAHAEWQRAKALLARKLISLSDFDARRSAYEAAQARFDQAQSQLSGGTRQTGYTQLQADRAGVVTSMQAEVGQIVAAGQPVLHLALPGEKEIAISIPENRRDELSMGQDVSITIWAVPGKLYQGRIREISPLADPLTRTYGVKVTLMDPDDAVQLGMTAAVQSRHRVAEASVRLPLTAITERDGRPAVWVVDAQTLKVTLQPVTLGPFQDNNQVTIASGLVPGQRVVTAGVHKLYPNQQIRLLDNVP
ncbi:MAG: efflux RND transporter periplasmic adaptor subunit [Candidatus Competibacteraceae bacterium]|uniref:Cation/multidrug efflux system, mebrane-fusion component AcrA n=1 Tax=Candidatus Contendobacter odensis Run_B_J11 TaxID=1400861 RepID=A0A7U7G8T2_9GAMM|nr:efflux RND transporter periplasmic adaptor subunit [Candidatus Contendobacter odensis]MBK8535552.1 efflux RND transporter periplasmic adaptor subunit [Candidatus Competibacteraceae bacterium]CDH44011.1 putative Cation/multidrug efflux system, mebrane-fusion component AcrA [Candidatus Contendobacter odensis Run_B_J11]